MQSNEYFKNYVAKNNVKITCDICNCQILKFNKPLHERTQKHQKKLEIYLFQKMKIFIMK